MFDFTNLITVLRQLFTDRTYGTALEQYIVSRNPTNQIDVERYTREFELKNGSSLW